MQKFSNPKPKTQNSQNPSVKVFRNKVPKNFLIPPLWKLSCRNSADWAVPCSFFTLRCYFNAQYTGESSHLNKIKIFGFLSRSWNFSNYFAFLAEVFAINPHKKWKIFGFSANNIEEKCEVKHSSCK